MGSEVGDLEKDEPSCNRQLCLDRLRDLAKCLEVQGVEVVARPEAGEGWPDDAEVRNEVSHDATHLPAPEHLEPVDEIQAEIHAPGSLGLVHDAPVLPVDHHAEDHELRVRRIVFMPTEATLVELVGDALQPVVDDVGGAGEDRGVVDVGGVNCSVAMQPRSHEVVQRPP